MGAGHTHSHRRDGGSIRKLKLALVLTSVYMVAEAVGGWLSNSLALLADAGHMLTDVAAMSLTLAAIWFGSRPATARKTFGYHRLEILAAFVNGIALVMISFWVIKEAWERWQTPPEIKGFEMTAVAVGGLAVNLVAAFLLHGDHQHDLNLRGAWLHVVGDALGSVAAIFAGIVIMAFGWGWADAVSSVLISAIIIFSSWNLIRESVNVLLEGTPSHINLKALEEAIFKTEGVEDVHDLHVWTITSGMEALSVHVVHREIMPQKVLLERIRERIHDESGIHHITIQLELSEEDVVPHPCFSGANCFGSKTTAKIAGH